MLAGAMLLAPVQNADAFPLEGVQSKAYHDNGFVSKGSNVWQKTEIIEKDACLIYIGIDMDNDNKMSVGDIMATFQQGKSDDGLDMETRLKVERVDGKINNSSEDKLSRKSVAGTLTVIELQK
jgi:hypothetical protein